VGERLDGRQALTVALLGGGNVGSQVARLLRQNAADLAARAGAPLELTGVAVRDAVKVRADVPAELLTTDIHGLAASGADLVVELVGGVELANTLVTEALLAGSSVVTANKALIAEHGAQLHRLAAQQGVDLYYEAAVAGAIPLLGPLSSSLAGDRVRRVLGIVNGTTNYILTKMDEEGADFAAVLADAQALGYAEADPTADVQGHDAAAKAAILAGLAFHTAVTAADVDCAGIAGITAEDVRAARDMGYVIKLLAIAEELPHGVLARVHPTMVPRTHPLAGVREAYNAVFVTADSAGDLMFYGRGAGGRPTASAVLGDLVTAARHRVAGIVGTARSSYAELPVLPITEATTAYYLNLHVADRPGVLATVASIFAEHGVSIAGVRQEGIGDEAALIVRTHPAKEAAHQATVAALRREPAVRAVAGLMRVEGAV
jgi:homoserine dehydrogenase